MTPELEKSLHIIEEFVHVNDTDTIARRYPDSLLLATAQGSWSDPVYLTLGDLRKIAEAMKDVKAS